MLKWFKEWRRRRRLIKVANQIATRVEASIALDKEADPRAYLKPEDNQAELVKRYRQNPYGVKNVKATWLEAMEKKYTPRD